MSLPNRTSQPTLSVGSIDDLLGVVPHLLGFHPAESLVIVVVEDGRVAVTARCDLDDLTGPGQVEQLILRVLGRFARADAFVIAHTADPGTGWPVLARAEAVLGPRCLESLLVDGCHWWVGGPGTPPHPYDPRSSPAAVAATVHGLQARAGRADLATLFAPCDPPGVADGRFAAAVMALRRLRGERWPRAMTRTMAGALTGREPITGETGAALAVLSNRPEARDRALVALTRDNAPRFLAVWCRVVTLIPPEHQLQPLGLAGLAAWVSGDGALSLVALERAEALDPGAGLVAMLNDINERVLPPSAWDELQPRMVSWLDEQIRAARPRTPRRRR